MRTAALPRAIARLCLIALVLNLFAPIAWAALVPAPLEPAVLCQEPADHGASHAPSHSGQPNDHAPHCPLCVLFGGTGWAPPATIPVLVADSSARESVSTAVSLPAPALPRTLRPTPRAPPASI